MRWACFGATAVAVVVGSASAQAAKIPIFIFSSNPLLTLFCLAAAAGLWVYFHHKGKVEQERFTALRPVLNAAAADHNAGKWPEAIAGYSQVVDQFPKLHGVRLARGNARLNARDLDGATSDYSAVIIAEPKNAEALFMRAIAHGEAGRHATAVSDLTRVLKLGKHASAYQMRGRMKAQMGDTTGAVADFTEAIGLKREIGTLEARAACYVKLGDTARADRDQQMIAEMRPPQAVVQPQPLPEAPAALETPIRFTA